MSWAEKTGKSGGGAGGGVKIVEEENDFPIAKPNYMRIGSAHAVERGSDRAALEALLKKFADAINIEFGQSPESNTIVVEEK
jgi:hypothetical protein